MTGGASTPTLWAVTPERIQEAMRRIVQTAHPRAVLLFGSHARGDAKPHSDIDLGERLLRGGAGWEDAV